MMMVFSLLSCCLLFWPTRAALLTGYYAQQTRRDALPAMTIGKRPEYAKLLPKLL